MQLGAILPSFADTADEAIVAARLLEEGGFHGAFCYDHLWPMHEPGRPTISPFPLLGFLAKETSRIRLGTLVARVSLVPDEVLISEMQAVQHLSDGRLIAGLGAGDQKSAAENTAYGVPFAPAEVRRAALRRVAIELAERGCEVWIGGGSSATNEIASEVGATLNLWGSSPERVATMAQMISTTWAGRFPADPERASAQLTALREAGASWAVYIWPGALEPLVEAARGASIALDAPTGR